VILFSNSSQLNRKGQIAVWVVLVAVVGLTLGLSIASRALSNIQQSSELEETNRAFSAAEAGIEKALYALETTGTATSVLTPIPLPEAGSEYYYEVTEGGGGGDLVLSAPLEKDQVAQIDCSNMSGTITVYWAESGTSQAQDGNRASLLLTFVGDEGSDYAVVREAYNPAEEAAARDNGFSVASSGTYVIGGRSFAESSAAISLPGSGTSKILRVYALYNQVPNTIGLQASGSVFPAQYHVVTATGTAGGGEMEVVRKVQVTRSKPVLPAFFDYTLFNLSTNSLSK